MLVLSAPLPHGSVGWLVPVLASKEIQAGYEQKGGVWTCFAGGNSSRSAAGEDHFSVTTDLVLI